MPVIESLKIALFLLLTVFVVLAGIFVIIKLFSLLVRSIEKSAQRKE